MTLAPPGAPPSRAGADPRAGTDPPAGADVPPYVTAVLVARDGAAFLPRTLQAVAGQTRPPDLLLAADAGSTDETPELLGEVADLVVTLPAEAGAGACRAQALAAVPADLPARGAGGPAVEWLWLLDDDAAPAPHALEHLLAEVETSPSVAVAGCKQVLWDDEQRLLDVGFTTSPLGARITGLDRGEVDQGQHDDRRDVLAVSTPGMLVRRDLWDLLEGPDPALSDARADLDLCRRAHRAGRRVVVVPGAVVANAEATRTGRRPGAPDWYRMVRRDALHLRLATAPAPLLAPVVLWSLLAALVRCLGWLVLKRPERAGAEVVALATALSRPGAVRRSRARLQAVRTVPRRALRRLGAGPREILRQRRDEISAWIRPRRTPRPELASARPPVRLRRSLVAPAVAVLLPALAAAIAVGRLAVRRPPGAAVGPVLLPAPSSAADLWAAAWSSWRPVGLGAPAAGDPAAALLALLSLPLGADPRRTVPALLLAALPAAALAAWAAAGAVTRSRLLRVWAGLAWAAAPPLIGAVGSGRPATVVAHVALPLTALALARAVRPPSGSVAAAAACGVLLTAVLAAAPSLTLPAVAALVAAAVVARRRAASLLLTIVVPAVLLLPWWQAVAAAPRLLLTDPALADASARPGAASAAWHLLLLPESPAALLGPVASPGGLAALLGLPGAAPRPDVLPGLTAAVGLVALAVLAVPVLALGLAGSARRGTAGLVALVAWTGAAGGLAVALAAPRVPLGRAAGAVVHGEAGPALSLLLLGAGTGALLAARGLARRLDRRARRGRRGGRTARAALVPAVLAATVLGPVALLGAWSAATAAGEPTAGTVHRTDPDVLPAVAAAEAAGPAGTRTLVLASDRSGVRWRVARASGPRLGESSAALALARLGARGEARDDDVVAPVVAGLLSDSGQDLRPRLADLAVGSVLLLRPVDEETALALDASPGLVRLASTRAGVLWRVAFDASDGAPGRPVRARILDAAGERTLAALPTRRASSAEAVRTVIAPGPPGRLLVLADRAGAGWHAELDGAALPRTVVRGWAQAFLLPARGGDLVVAHADGPLWGLDALRLLVAVLAVLVALPLPSVRGRVAPPPRPRASRPVRRSAVAPTAPAPSPRVFDADHPEEGELEPVLSEPVPATRRERRS